ncbi:hypothetical protein [Pedobacter sp. MR2016-24]|uniref:hypothetical protein n=1 Tax=Pedobacter sp. MR2016-24 TaxID=2994466 RepID=UPI00224840F3|nr:hypothetical protein [Pedobacter sp. MR2016-24]MCX2483852.1 hypothetical protein [Pedobacter sp. MR2016-24]
MNKRAIRPLGTNEKVFWVLDQKTTTQFAVAAEIDGNATDHSWREALDSVQKRHPNLAVQISGNTYSTAFFEPIADCKIPLSFVYTKREENWNELLERELNIPLNITAAPLAKALVIQQSGKSVFIFISNHSIGDGMSVALFIRDILTVLSGETITPLRPVSPLDQLAGIIVKEIPAEDLSGFKQLSNSVAPRSAVNIRRLKLSHTLTDSLIKRAKNEKTTVHCALSAALVIALKQVESTLKEKPVRILHPLSARTTLGLGDDYGLLMNILTLPYDPAPKDTFWNFAKTIRKGIASTQTLEWIKSVNNATRELFYNGLDVNTVEHALRQGTEHEILLTNLGQISFKADYGRLTLKSLWGPMVLTAHDAAQTVGVATYNGALTLTLTGISLSEGLLEAVERIIDQVCNASDEIRMSEFFNKSI